MAGAIGIVLCGLTLDSGISWPESLEGQAALSKTQTPAQYSNLLERSALLTPGQRAKATEMFSTGFALWQSGDFAAAAKAFQLGLDIDPANVPANYYLGDCLLRGRHPKLAADFFTRASKLGGGTPESFKAEVALEEISKQFSTDDMSPDEIKAMYVGAWVFDRDKSEFVIYRDERGELHIKGKFPKGCHMWGCLDYNNLSFDGHSVYFLGGDLLTYNLQLTSPSQLGGTFMGTGNITATKDRSLK